ncbi:hypothetical protein EIP86_002443 [Pleurotus ostreatoroseus]|nr:hypothetical protein EIP86_002443 [Pleurotus ostreatoroseus]
MNINAAQLRDLVSNLPLNSRSICPVCPRLFEPEPGQEETCSRKCAEKYSYSRLIGEAIMVTRRCARCGLNFQSSTSEPKTIICAPCANGTSSRQSLAYDDAASEMTIKVYDDPAPSKTQTTGSRLRHMDRPLPTPLHRSHEPPPPPPKTGADLRRAHSHPVKPPSSARRPSSNAQDESQQPPATPPKPTRSLSSRSAHGPSTLPAGHASAPVPEKYPIPSSSRRAGHNRIASADDVQRVYVPPPLTRSSSSSTKELPPLPKDSPPLIRNPSLRRVAFEEGAFSGDWSPPPQRHGPSRSNTLPLRSAMRRNSDARTRPTRPSSDSSSSRPGDQDVSEFGSFARPSSPLARNTVRASELNKQWDDPNPHSFFHDSDDEDDTRTLKRDTFARPSSPLVRSTTRATQHDMEQPVASSSRSSATSMNRTESRSHRYASRRCSTIHWVDSSKELPDDVPESAASSRSPSPTLEYESSEPGTPRAFQQPQPSPPVDVPLFLDTDDDFYAAPDSALYPPEGADLLPPLPASQEPVFTQRGRQSYILNRPTDSRRSSVYSTNSINVSMLAEPWLARTPGNFDPCLYSAVLSMRDDLSKDADEDYKPRFTYSSEA